MQLLNHFICLQELDCTGEYLKPVIMGSLCNIEISRDKRNSDCPFFAVCYEVPLATLREGFAKLTQLFFQ